MGGWERHWLLRRGPLGLPAEEPYAFHIARRVTPTVIDPLGRALPKERDSAPDRFSSVWLGRSVPKLGQTRPQGASPCQPRRSGFAPFILSLQLQPVGELGLTVITSAQNLDKNEHPLKVGKHSCCGFKLLNCFLKGWPDLFLEFVFPCKYNASLHFAAFLAPPRPIWTGQLMVQRVKRNGEKKWNAAAKVFLRSGNPCPMAGPFGSPLPCGRDTFSRDFKVILILISGSHRWLAVTKERVCSP